MAKTSPKPIEKISYEFEFAIRQNGYTKSQLTVIAEGKDEDEAFNAAKAELLQSESDIEYLQKFRIITKSHITAKAEGKDENEAFNAAKAELPQSESEEEYL